MSIVAEHHRWKDKDHKPLPGWPVDCKVQWGGRGVVLSKVKGQSYSTAFFEAFPKGGGFIRGEGATIRDAEADAFAQFRRMSVCDHEWSRGKFINGGAICRQCRGFQKAFKPIVTLGAWCEPLSPMSLDFAAEGALRPCPEDPQHEKSTRAQWLKAKRMGIDLPDYKTAPPQPLGFEEDVYAKASRKAIVTFLLKTPHYLASCDKSGVSGIFEELHVTSLQQMLVDHANSSKDALSPHHQQE